MNKYYSLNIPANIKIICWKKKNITKIFLISENKKLKLIFINNSFLIDKWSNSVVVYNSKKNIKENKINKKFFEFLKSWSIYFFSKIKFKGKGFRIKFFKKIKLIKFYFGRSHKTFILLKNLKKKKINKYKFILFHLKKKKLINTNKLIINIKPLNIYTLRGLKLSRQIIYKRKGKKGTYI